MTTYTKSMQNLYPFYRRLHTQINNIHYRTFKVIYRDGTSSFDDYIHKSIIYIIEPSKLFTEMGHPHLMTTYTNQ